jgi:ketosteroid isomerase-like protein
VTELDRIEIVDSALRSLTAALRRRDADGVLALFHDDAVLFGSEDGELAVGALELREFLASIFDRPGTYGWSGWDPVLTGGTEDLVWFVAPAIVVVRDDAGGEEAAPYRLSGVLERTSDGRWLFRVFNGAEPVSTADEPRT